MSAIEILIKALERKPGVDPAQFVADLDATAVDLLVEQIKTEEEAERFGKFDRLFPYDGPFRRELYPKQMEFFEAGARYRERCFLAANRIGKTVGASYEVTCHMTGKYKPWWPGRRFRRPVSGWVAGDTNETTRDIIQRELLGEVGYRGNRKTMDGSGIIPRECIGDVSWKQGVQNLVDTIEILHVNGGSSLLGFKSYDQGRRVFQGTAQEIIWLDEEPPLSVYGECLIRTATTRGMVMMTFTPLSGMSDTVMQFLPVEMRPGE